MFSDTSSLFFFFFNDTATTEIYTFPTRRSSDLRDLFAVRLDVGGSGEPVAGEPAGEPAAQFFGSVRLACALVTDRKSTRLNSSHGYISYAVFCLKKKQTA